MKTRRRPRTMEVKNIQSASCGVGAAKELQSCCFGAAHSSPAIRTLCTLDTVKRQRCSSFFIPRWTAEPHTARERFPSVLAYPKQISEVHHQYVHESRGSRCTRLLEHPSHVTPRVLSNSSENSNQPWPSNGTGDPTSRLSDILIDAISDCGASPSPGIAEQCR